MRRFMKLVFVFPILLSTVACGDDTEGLKKSVDALKQEVISLKAELRDVEKERDSLREELAKIKEKVPALKPEIAAIGTTWKGKFGDQGGAEQSATMRVMSRDLKKATIQIEIEAGAVWQFDCEFTTAKNIKIVDTRRIKANEGVDNPEPVGGVTGKGVISGKTFVLNYDWKKSGGNTKHRFEGNLE